MESMIYLLMKLTDWPLVEKRWRSLVGPKSLWQNPVSGDWGKAASVMELMAKIFKNQGNIFTFFYVMNALSYAAQKEYNIIQYGSLHKNKKISLHTVDST